MYDLFCFNGMYPLIHTVSKDTYRMYVSFETKQIFVCMCDLCMYVCVMDRHVWTPLYVTHIDISGYLYERAHLTLDGNELASIVCTNLCMYTCFS